MFAISGFYFVVFVLGMVAISGFYFVARSLHPQSRYGAKIPVWYRHEWNVFV